MSRAIETLENYMFVRRSLSLHINTMIKDMPLGHRQLTIMRWLDRNGEMNLKTLALYTYTDPATITRSVQQMIRQGLVEKVKSKDDGRQWMVRLSKKGQKYTPAIKKVYEDVAKIFIEGLSKSEQEQFSALLEKVGNSLEKKFSGE
ncbi:MarR family winged helix-turn-helix transcriptional regulator [Bdellovibrio sp. HCB2-146]|uniref:MarR family winged helix-turn-helix transcriptional regulator n=1 Tax=Bdellovibrio sp. HCB2-146 TaxID=3394362 RepID=UPI0039BD05C5